MPDHTWESVARELAEALVLNIWHQCECFTGRGRPCEVCFARDALQHFREVEEREKQRKADRSDIVTLDRAEEHLTDKEPTP